MSNIDKQALREIAAAAVGAHERLSVMPPDDIFDISLAEGTQLDADITALNALNSAANPTTVLALLDELESMDVQIANLTAERDALREGEMGDARHSNTRAAADIYFQLVEECEIPAGGSLVEYVDDMREKLEAAEKRIAELEAKLETADKLQDSAFRHGLQHGFSYGQTNDQARYEQCIAAYSQKKIADGIITKVGGVGI
ncbi:TPA: ead/Ea22-like family protein [Escherichia coli]|uniref:ead/Ea22-like family protein n=1 Tax=Escherichia coli TaxID=562 RepID=UPI000BE5F672|nr:ead/Ea22-like family protein [Escherichia coli]EIQ2250074.1 ead/Ea22-like family protein [Escherichia coli]